jgi:tRNA (guanine37-N1)-methyltransferase
MKIGVITLFPEIFPGPLACSILYKGLEKKYWSLEVIDLKKYHHHVDDTIYGGGEGMLIRADVLGQAIDEHMVNYEHLVFMVPFGKPWHQQTAQSFAQYASILIVCGRYEGIDYRIYEYYKSQYSVAFVSIGDYIMAGGEIPAMVIIESVIRLLWLRWKVTQEESFSQNLLEPPQYTRPLEWKGLVVPEVLLSGHHGKIAQWRQQQGEAQTQQYRPDLLPKN